MTSSSGHAVSCTGSGGTLKPLNYGAIVTFLTAHGYSDNAAAGIAGNIYAESGGNPESVGDGGGGLIGWTPLPGGYVTGNPAADLQTQLNAILRVQPDLGAVPPHPQRGRQPGPGGRHLRHRLRAGRHPGLQPPRSRGRGGGRRLWSVTRPAAG